MPAAPLNILPFAPVAGSGSGAAASGATGATGAAAGFEALLAAMFGAAGGQPGAATPANAIAAKADTKQTKTGEVLDATDTADGDLNEADATSVDGQAQALAAALFFAPAKQPATTEATAAEPAEGAAQPASATVPGAATPDDALLAEAAVDDAAPAEVDAPALADVLRGKGRQADNVAGQPSANTPRPAAPVQTGPVQAGPVQTASVPAAGAQTPAPADAVAAPALLAASQAAAEAAAPAQAGAVAAEAGAPKAATRAVQPGEALGAADAGDASDAAADADGAPRVANGPSPVQAKASDKPVEDALLAPSGEPDLADAKVASDADSPDALPQAGSTQASQGASAQHSATAVVRGSPETVASLAADILKKLDGNSSRFDVQLDPAGLGRVDVRIEIGAHGRLMASLNFENPQAANELRGRSAELQRTLEQAGFDLSGGLSFNSGDSRGGAGQGLAGQQQQQQDGGGASRGRAFQAALDVADGISDVAATAALQYQRRTESGVDIRI